MARRILLGALLGLLGTQLVSAEDRSEVQSVLLRAVIVTHDLDASMRFYRDYLGQRVIESRELDALRSQKYLDISDQARVTHIIFEGRGEYPGGPINGGRMSLIAIDDPQYMKPKIENRRGRQGDMILPHRVSGLDEIYRRMLAGGVEVLVPPSVSSTGLSRSMMVFDPNGKIVELFELFNTRAPAAAPAPP